MKWRAPVVEQLPLAQIGVVGPLAAGCVTGQEVQQVVSRSVSRQSSHGWPQRCMLLGCPQRRPVHRRSATKSGLFGSNYPP